MIRTAVPCFGAILLLAATLFAADHVDIWTSADLKNSSDRLAIEADAKSIAGKTLGAWGNHSASLWRRSKSGAAELHKTKTDLMVIEEGSATLITGGLIPDAKNQSPEEVRGTSIKGGESHKVGPGDIIRIPPGTPHQFVLEKGQSVSYFALKLGLR
jgi:mannose-6-phosphate isomerase-like protein (cupin superfamily)